MACLARILYIAQSNRNRFPSCSCCADTHTRQSLSFLSRCTLPTILCQHATHNTTTSEPGQQPWGPRKLHETDHMSRKQRRICVCSDGCACLHSGREHLDVHESCNVSQLHLHAIVTEYQISTLTDIKLLSLPHRLH